MSIPITLIYLAVSLSVCMYRTAVELVGASSWNFMLENFMKNVPSYFNCNSDQTVLTATSLKAVNVFLHTCAVAVKLNWSTVARMQQNCKVSWSTTLLEEQTCCMMHTFPNLFLMYWTYGMFILQKWSHRGWDLCPFHHRHPTFTHPPPPPPQKKKILLFIPRSLLYLNAPSIITCNEIMIV
jgi:hypothetical protein